MAHAAVYGKSRTYHTSGGDSTGSKTDRLGKLRHPANRGTNTSAPDICEAAITCMPRAQIDPGARQQFGLPCMTLPRERRQQRKRYVLRRRPTERTLDFRKPFDNQSFYFLFIFSCPRRRVALLRLFCCKRENLLRK